MACNLFKNKIACLLTQCREIADGVNATATQTTSPPFPSSHDGFSGDDGRIIRHTPEKVIT